MNVTLERSEIRTLTRGLGRIIPRTVTLPVLGCVRFSAGNGSLSAEGTDLDQAAVCRLNAIVDGEGSFLLPFAYVKALGKGAPDEHVDITATGNKVTVTNRLGAQTLSRTFTDTGTDEWPATKIMARTRPAPAFLETYRKLLPFASTDETRNLLTGVYVDTNGTGQTPVTMVATDGRRLTCCNTLALPLHKPVIVPRRDFLLWTALLDEALGIAEAHDLQTLVLTSGPWTYWTKTTEGTYPNWRQVLPRADDAADHVVFTDEDVASLANILPAFADGRTHHDSVRLGPGPNNGLTVTGRHPGDETETEVKLSGGTSCDAGVSIAVNAAYLLDALHAGFRRFAVTDAFSPMRADDGHGAIHVLMPMRLGNEPATTDKKQQQTPPVAENRKEEIMPDTKDTKTENEITALDKVMAAYETAKAKVKEANQALNDIADAVKAAAKEQRQQRTEIESVRAALAKLQSIKV